MGAFRATLLYNKMRCALGGVFVFNTIVGKNTKCGVIEGVFVMEHQPGQIVLIVASSGGVF